MDWFAEQILSWSEHHGRENLPWQLARDPYKVWIAEIMLQQTQVETVIPFFTRFIEEFPNIKKLSRATEDEVLDFWSGLGYYRRARLLHQAAIEMVQRHSGEVPSGLDELCALPGIGRSTAGGIRAGGFGLRGVILDGNVKRVLSRVHTVSGPVDSSKAQNELWNHAEAHTPENKCAEYAQAVMDFGAKWCTKSNPRCGECPINKQCQAFLTDTVGEFPTKNRRTRQTQMSLDLLVILDHTGSVLLEKRPAQGIWPGLWVPPELSNTDDKPRVIDALNLQKDGISREYSLPRFEHVLSHRRIEVTCHVIETKHTASGSLANQDLQWCRIDRRPRIGVPKITLRIFDALRTGGEIN